ncbi:MAG: S4 domain-containing protein, partial [Candidatus Pacebacteria bacterium]|nr:S4 domain-containing protein [Candidatus Paceibacterota bacterium]
MDYPIRINKYIRDRGLASRREADKLVDDGLVLINGKISEKGDMVNKEDHVVLKENKKEYKYIAYYKPCGLS